jgi:hypothetical protein
VNFEGKICSIDYVMFFGLGNFFTFYNLAKLDPSPPKVFY